MMDITDPLPDRQPVIDAKEITDPEERLMVWAQTHAGDLELEPLPSWLRPSNRKAPHDR